MDFLQILQDVSGLLWGVPMVVLLMGTHLFLTIRLRCPQLKIFKAIKLSFQKDSDSEGDITPFAALATSLAATVGTGNIIGVATAIALGGPGAVLWCWITGILGIATKYAEGLLAVKYRVKTSNGEMLGGPMYALERGLGMKWLAVLFSIFTVGASFGIGSTVQANSIAVTLNQTVGLSPYITGITLALLVTLVVFYGVKGIAKTCVTLVPFMAIFYIIGCLVIIFLNRDFLGETFSLIASSAFNTKAAAGGFVGSTLMSAARFGIARGLFSNESGMGSAPIIAAAAQTRNPVRQALISSTSTFWDSVIISALTGIVVVSTIVAYPEIGTNDGSLLTNSAFGKIPFIGTPLLTIGIVTFALSTTLGWYYYAEKCIEYLAGKKAIKFFKIIWISSIVVGCVASLEAVWYFSDIVNGLMAIPNLVALLLLSGVVVAETRKYLWNNALDEYAPDEFLSEEEGDSKI